MSTSTGAASKPEPQTMSVRELKEELKAGGVNTTGMLEKEDLVAAVKSSRMEASASAKTTSAEATCSHCGKKDVALKSCSRCLQTSYCGAECQRAAWKGHKMTCVKTTCAPPLPLRNVWDLVLEARNREDWKGVLKWEGRMEEFLAQQSDPSACDLVLHSFSLSHKVAFNMTGTQDHALSFISLEDRRLVVLAKLQRFRDQGEAMCEIGGMLRLVDKMKDAAGYFERARAVGAGGMHPALLPSLCFRRSPAP